MIFVGLRREVVSPWRQKLRRCWSDLPGTRGKILHLVRTTMVRTAGLLGAGAADQAVLLQTWPYNDVHILTLTPRSDHERCGPVRLVRPADRVEGERTPGMMREQAIAVDGMWAGLVRTEAQMTTGWHHHADYDTSIYVVDGRLRMEFGPGGSEVVEAGQATSCMCLRVRSIAKATRPMRKATSSSSELVVGPAVINVRRTGSWLSQSARCMSALG